MTNSTKTTRYSTIFLAAILVAGTITTFLPSFMVGTAQAAPYPDMDREKKDDKKSVSVSSLKCNNINVNVNGLTLDVFPPFLGGGDLAAEAVEPNTEDSSFASGNNGDGSHINDFRFICINNNNNTVVGAEEPIPPTPPVDPCEDCFAQELNATQFADVEETLAGGIEITLAEVPEPIVIHSFAELCALIEENPNQIFSIIDQVLTAADIGIGEGTFIDIVECIALALNITIH